MLFTLYIAIVVLVHNFYSLIQIEFCPVVGSLSSHCFSSTHQQAPVLRYNVNILTIERIFYVIILKLSWKAR